jgi:hypothetical protein
MRGKSISEETPMQAFKREIALYPAQCRVVGTIIGGFVGLTSCQRSFLEKHLREKGKLEGTLFSASC